jgi:predicted RNase H-like nuclease
MISGADHPTAARSPWQDGYDAERLIGSIRRECLDQILVIFSHTRSAERSMHSDPTACVAGVDGAPGGWAVVITGPNQSIVKKITAIADLFENHHELKAVAIDVPIGLLDSYEIGGRACDKAARKLLGRMRGSSVFPPPVRSALLADSWIEACANSRASNPQAKGISKQTFAIFPKIIEVDALLQTRPQLRDLTFEVHPEICFAELGGRPLTHRKSSRLGRQERRELLAGAFPDFEALEKNGREQRLPIEDILDALVACWSALRLASGKARKLTETIARDRTGLPMTIWV